MAGHYPQHGNSEYSMAGAPDPRYQFHGSEQIMTDLRIPIPQDHMGGVAFWYRPDNSLPIVERDEGVHLSQGGLGGLEGVKHRRTRSGCFTCRSRRVKVRDIYRLPSPAHVLD